MAISVGFQQSSSPASMDWSTMSRSSSSRMYSEASGSSGSEGSDGSGAPSLKCLDCFSTPRSHQPSSPAATTDRRISQHQLLQPHHLFLLVLEMAVPARVPASAARALSHSSTDAPECVPTSSYPSPSAPRQISVIDTPIVQRCGQRAHLGSTCINQAKDKL